MFDRAYVILSILKLFCLYWGDFVYTKKISSASCTLMVKLLLKVHHVWLAYVICQNWNGFIYTEMIFFYIEMILSTLKWFIYIYFVQTEMILLKNSLLTVILGTKTLYWMGKISLSLNKSTVDKTWVWPKRISKRGVLKFY